MSTFTLFRELVEDNGKTVRDMAFTLLMEKNNKDDRPICEPWDAKDEEDGETCQGCGQIYDPDTVMIVDDVGAVCFNCLYHLTREILG